jgi:hypothetical protein
VDDFVLCVWTGVLHRGNIYACLTDATNEQITITVYYFYDAPILPPGVFDDFRAITPTQGNATTMSYSDFILSLDANTTASRLVVHFHAQWNRGTDIVPTCPQRLAYPLIVIVFCVPLSPWLSRARC